MTEAIASSIGTIPEPIENDNLDYVKIDTSQKAINITVKRTRPGDFCSTKEIADKAIETWIYAKEQLEKLGYTVSPLGQPVTVREGSDKAERSDNG